MYLSVKPVHDPEAAVADLDWAPLKVSLDGSSTWSLSLPYYLLPVKRDQPGVAAMGVMRLQGFGRRC